MLYITSQNLSILQNWNFVSFVLQVFLKPKKPCFPLTSCFLCTLLLELFFHTHSALPNSHSFLICCSSAFAHLTKMALSEQLFKGLTIPWVFFITMLTDCSAVLCSDNYRPLFLLWQQSPGHSHPLLVLILNCLWWKYQQAVKGWNAGSRRKKVKQETRIICWPVENQMLTEIIRLMCVSAAHKLIIKPHYVDEKM